MVSFLSDTWRARLETILPLSQPQSSGSADSADPREPVLVLGGDDGWAQECAVTLRTLGLDPAIATDIEAATHQVLSQPISVAIVDYDLRGSDPVALGRELVRLAAAQGRKLHFLLASAHASKDTALAAIRGSAADLLEKPIRPGELRRTLQRLAGLDQRPEARGTLLARMIGLQSDLLRLTHLLEEPAATHEPCSHCAPAAEPVDDETDSEELMPGAIAQYIRDLLKAEARRRAIGPGNLFGDPAWEMLLDLLLAKIERRRVSISSACIASGAAMSTALRLVGRFVDEGVLRKIPDETDRRRHFLTIEPRFERPLLDYLSEQVRKSAVAR